MQIAEGIVVSMEYALKDDEGTLLDQSQPGAPLQYLHGFKNIIPGLESQLEGKAVGDQVDARVAPVDGYGEVNPALQQVVPRDRFQGVEGLEVGMQFQANTEQGPISVRIIQIEDEDVTVDGNHPLAGKHLNFSVTIQEVREATEEEKSHGHIHAGGGCCGGNGGGEDGCCNDEPEAKAEGECGEGSCGCSN